MRVRSGSPLLLLLLAAPSLSHALQIWDSQANPNLRRRDAPLEILETNGENHNKYIAADPPAPAAADSAKPKESLGLRPYKATGDAPVDGADGKPHTGPFVYEKDDEAKGSGDAAARPADLNKWTHAGSEEWRVDEIPEKNDGVMNDENRVAPKKGTDGTAGGISEKEKERKMKGGVQAENLPQEPKEAPPLPHSEEELKQQREKGATKEKIGGSSKEGERSGTRVVDTSKEKDNKFGAGGYGIDLPEDLPEKPHNMPHPDPNTGAAQKGGEPPVDGTKSNWLLDTMPYTEGQKPKLPPVNPAAAEDRPPSSSSEDEGWHEWFHSFVLSFTMILFSEIGDKTFLVAALMAMRHPRVLVFTAAFTALLLMTVLSAVLGHAFPALLPKRLTTFAAACLFLVFGARGLREGLAMPPDTGVGDEMKEVEAELEEKEHSIARSSHHRSTSPYSLEAGRPKPASRSPSPTKNSSGGGLVNLCSLVLSPAWVQTFVMTFLGEWGDRSQIATIAMAAGQDYWWVTVGAVAGHAVCTGVAVVGGRALAGRVSMRVVTIGGAIAFLFFGLIYLFESLYEEA